MTKRFLILAIICLYLSPLQAIFPDNIFRLGYLAQTTKFHGDKKSVLTIDAEGAFDAVAHNTLGNSVNILQIWQPNQDTLTMLRGFDANTQIGNLVSILNSANDDGVRGHILPSAKLSGYRLNFMLRHKLPFNLTGNILVPVIGMKLSNVSLIDQTKNISFTDQLVKTNLTDNLAQVVYNLGDKLDIDNGWNKNGLGDIEVVLGWRKSFKQVKPILKNVKLGIYSGLSLPTGVLADQDKLFPIPFGNDGAVGIIFGGNIELQWWKHLRFGIVPNFLYQLPHSRNRRVKTDIDQTDLFLLAKTDTLKEPGFTQQYALYLEGYKLFNTLNLRTTYEYIKHNQDTLNIFNQTYTSQIANTAISLQEWTMHNMIFSLAYVGDFTATVYYKQPFNGKNSIQSKILGATLDFYF